MLKGFKDFLLRGNVVDLAVAVVIGAAFTALVASFTASFLKPLIGLISGGGVTGGTKIVDGQAFTYGAFINAADHLRAHRGGRLLRRRAADEGDHRSGASAARRPARRRPPRSSCWWRSATCCGPSRAAARADPSGPGTRCCPASSSAEPQSLPQCGGRFSR